MTGALGRQVAQAITIAVGTTALIVHRGGGGKPGERPTEIRYYPPRTGPRGTAARWVVAVIFVGLAFGGAIAVASGDGTANGPRLVAGAPLPGLLTGAAPWPRNVVKLGPRLDALGLPRLAREGTALHAHEHLDLFVGGRPVTVPAGIGIDHAARFIAPIHTHDASGVVHVESPRVRTFTLGELFGVWGLRLTPRCLGGYCASGAQRLAVFADGRPVPGDPRRLPLSPAAEIVVAFGTRAQLPRPLPARYDFPPGL